MSSHCVYSYASLLVHESLRKVPKQQTWKQRKPLPFRRELGEKGRLNCVILLFVSMTKAKIYQEQKQEEVSWS